MEADVLAERILQRESFDLLLDEERLSAIRREIALVLARIRDRHPAMTEVYARDHYLPGMLVIGLEGELLDAVLGLWSDESASPVPPTGHPAFDALNEALRLRAVEVFGRFDVVAMDFGERVNINAAIEAYEAIDGVTYVEPEVRLGDASDVDATKSHGAWHVVFRKAWGDCPAGCIYQELSFFTVRDGHVERIEPSQVRCVDALSTLVGRRGWHRF